MRTTCKKPCVCSCNFIFKIQKTCVQLHKASLRSVEQTEGNTVKMMPPTWSFCPSAFTVDGTTLYLPIPHPQHIPNPLSILRLFLNTSLQILPRLELAKRFHSPPPPPPPVLNTAPSRGSPGAAQASGHLLQYQAVPWHLPGLLSSLYLHPLLRESTWMAGTEPVFTLWGSWHTQYLSTLPIALPFMQTVLPISAPAHPPPFFILLAWCIHSQTADT